MGRLYLDVTSLTHTDKIRWDLSFMYGYVGKVKLNVWGVYRPIEMSKDRYATYWDHIAELTGTNLYYISNLNILTNGRN